MEIGLIELMPKGHYTLVNSIIQIYHTDPGNNIYVYTHHEGADLLRPLVGNLDHVYIVEKKADQKPADFFDRIAERRFDKLYIVTLDTFFSSICRLSTSSPLYLFVHNNENWFLLSPWHLIYRFFANVVRTKKLLYSLKVSFIHPFHRKKIRRQVINSKGKFVILNKLLRNDLIKYVDDEKIEVIPFSVFLPSEKKQKDQHRQLRICIPGLIDGSRRDYYSVFSCLESEKDFFRDRLELELLGGVADAKSSKILQEADRMNSLGFNIKYHAVPFIPFDEYNRVLENTDVILGNFYTVLNRYSKYGRTKETGVVYAMISAAKPGILPADYELMEELRSSTLQFDTYQHLSGLIKKLINDQEFLKTLKFEAEKNAEKFTPDCIYQTLL
jgi:hypothetical protein